MLVLVDLRRNWPRTLILMLAIASSVALSFDLLSLTYGIRESTGSSLDRVEADLYVLPEGLNPLFRDLQRFDQGGSVMEEIQGSPRPPERMAPRLKGSLFVEPSGSKVTEVLSTGVDPGAESTFGQYEVRSGSWFGTTGDPMRDGSIPPEDIGTDDLSGEIIVSERFSERLGVRVGDRLSIGLEPGSLHSGYTVKGIFIDVLSGGSEEVLIRLGEMQFFKGLLDSDSMTEILLAMGEGEVPGLLVNWSETGAFRFKDIVDVVTKEDFLSEIYNFTDTIAAFSALTIAVTVVVAVAFASTVLMISSRQRMKELSVLRAIGRSRAGIFQQVTAESLLLSLTGGLVGTAFGIGTIIMLNRLLSSTVDGLPEYFVVFRVHPLAILLAVSLAASIGILSSLLPAISSAFRTPVSALRGEN